MVAQRMAVSHHEDRNGPCSPPPSPPVWESTEEWNCITTNIQYLHTSGWYWGHMSAGESRDALLMKSEGTFLVRDSSHPQYMLTLSVKTSRGPTSVRIQYSRGSFGLDCIAPGVLLLPSFPNVISLIHHYTNSDNAAQGHAASVDNIQLKAQHDPVQDSRVFLKLVRPLQQPETFHSLQHLTRLTINRHTNSPDQLPLPRPLLHYLQDYPFQI
ncbi:cytokine inducible SH2-containing protein b [Genypterus blacodes]|uniref:cytokine inducible SH2-containing protein b n=1 Tax=Genypterus blacodes TaxID=154954 RepID=UPI003F766945